MSDNDARERLIQRMEEGRYLESVVTEDGDLFVRCEWGYQLIRDPDQPPNRGSA